MSAEVAPRTNEMKAAAELAAHSMLGKSFSKLSAAERKGVGKCALWISQNGADPITIGHMVQSFKSPKFKP